MSTAVGRGRGRGRGLNKGWLGNFKPKPVPITVEEISKAENRDQFADSDEKVGSLTAKLSEQTLNNNNCVISDEKPASNREQDNKDQLALNSVLLNAVNVKEFVPTTFTPISPSPVSAPKHFIQGEEAPAKNAFFVGETSDEHAQGVLMNLVVTLTVSPGEFDNQIAWVASELRKHVKTEDSLKEIIRIILDEAIAETNFSYGAAKMCHYFDENNVFSGFRKVFFSKCQEIFLSETSAMKDAKTSDDFKRMANVAILFGELFCNMKLKGRPNIVYKKALLKFVPLFLESKEEILIRCLTRLLKLIGPDLDNYEKGRDIDEMFDKVRDFSFDPTCSGHLPEDVKQGIRKVYKLRTRNWDQGTPPSSPSTPTRATVMPQFPIPTQRKSSSSSIDWNDYYAGDDGDIYTNYMPAYPEEQHFGGGNFDGFTDEEEDEYEKFLRSSGQI